MSGILQKLKSFTFDFFKIIVAILAILLSPFLLLFYVGHLGLLSVFDRLVKFIQKN